jgi:hypothetical protein
MKHEIYLAKFVDLFERIDDALPAFQEYWRMHPLYSDEQENSPTPRNCFSHAVIPKVCEELVQFGQGFCRIFGTFPEG